MNSRLEQGEFSRSILHNGNALHVLSHSAPDQVLGLWRPSPCQLQEWLRSTDTPLLSRWFSHGVNDRRRVCTKIYIRSAAFFLKCGDLLCNHNSSLEPRWFGGTSTRG